MTMQSAPSYPSSSTVSPDRSSVYAPPAQIHPKLEPLLHEVRKIIVGQYQLLEHLLIALLAERHVLIEGVPGTAKTLTAISLGKAIGLQVKRIQMVPDMLPSDLLGTQILNPVTRSFELYYGPIFSNIVIVDEINRAPPKVQSALLEVMEEQQVTFARQTHPVPRPFYVFATQNPIEFEGTFALPEAQLDRFMFKVIVPYPSHNDELIIAERTLKGLPLVRQVLSQDDLLSLIAECYEVYVDRQIIEYAVTLCRATREPELYQVPHPKRIWLGVGPRGVADLLRAARARAVLYHRRYVTIEDVIALAPSVLRHRLVLSTAAIAEQVTPDQIIADVLAAVPRPNSLLGYNL